MKRSVRRKSFLGKSLAVILMAAVLLCVADPISAEAASWKKNRAGWWWQEDNGSYPVSEWKSIKGKWYHFNARGYMDHGWLKDRGFWYYLGSARDGSMKTGWVKTKGKWYLLGSDGKMLEGWQTVGGKRYYLKPGSGAMKTGWLKQDGKWYYLQSSGAMAGKGWHWVNGKCYYMDENVVMASSCWVDNYYVNGSGAWVKNAKPDKWVRSGSRWWYRHSDGSYTKNNWETIKGKKYHFDSAGWMQTGWLDLGGNWYYLGDMSDGAMKTGWQIINGKKYYMNSDGIMQCGIQTIDGNSYYFGVPGDGAMKTGWQEINGKRYLFQDTGVMRKGEWVGSCYFKENGELAVNTWVGDKYVGEDGYWIPDYGQKPHKHTHHWKDMGTGMLLDWAGSLQEDTGFNANFEAVSSINICRHCGYYYGLDSELFPERYWGHLEASDECGGAYTCVTVTAVYHLYECTECGIYKRGELAFYEYPTFPGIDMDCVPVYQHLTNEQIRELGLKLP